MDLQFYLILAVIVVLGLMNVGAMIWVSRLQKRIHKLTAQPHFEISQQQQAELNKRAFEQFKSAVEQQVSKLSTGLDQASANVVKQAEGAVSKFTTEELTQYSTAIKQSLDKVTQSMSQIEATMEQQRQTLTSNLDKDVAAEKARRLERFDQQLADIVAAYLVEALGSNVDLGAQSQYFFKVLEEHKEELKKDLMNEV